LERDAGSTIRETVSGNGNISPGRIILQLLVIVLFFLSGASSLIYEILWMRMFTQVFGSTTAATSTVLAAFMAGLALGSYLIGSYADRHPRNAVKMYAYLEAMIGIFGLLMPVLIQVLYLVYGWLFRNFEGNYILINCSRFILSLLVILVPTTMMGATLPVLSKHFVASHRTLCRWVGLLYGVNTFGAVVGSFVSGFFLVAWLGVTWTIYTAATMNFLIAIIALIIAGAGSSGAEDEACLVEDNAVSEQEPTVSVNISPGVRKLLLVVCFGAGCTSLALEVIWVRLLVFVLDSTVYAFCTMLTAFLFGIALGGIIIAGVYGRIKNELRWLGTLEILVGLSGLATIGVIAHITTIDAALRKAIMVFVYGGWWPNTALRFFEAFSIMLVPTVLMGMAFPLICKIYTRNISELGGSVGAVYAVNTFGAVLGSLGAGFVMIPLLGVARSIAIVAVIGVMLGGAVILVSRSRATGVLFAASTVVSVVCVVFIWNRPDIFSSVYSFPEPGSKLTYYYEGKSGTVTIHHYPPDERVLSVNGTGVAGTQFSLRTTQKLQAHIPMLVHGHAKKVMQIGFGSGESCHILSLYPVERIDLVEIDANVLEASDKFFRDLNHGIVRHPAFNAIIMDGKNYALLTDEKYDVIMNDSTFPGKSGSASLYTRDHFRACKQLLNEGGVMSSWIPLELKPEDFQNIAKTFQSVFPETTLWLANNCRNKHVLMVGTVEPFTVGFDRVAELMQQPAIREDLAEVVLDDPYAVLGSLVLAPDAVERYAALAPISSDDHPILEFSAGRHVGTAAFWAANHADFLKFRSSIVPYLRFSQSTGKDVSAVKDKMARYESANIHIDNARLSELKDEASGAYNAFRMITLERREEFEKALRINPGAENVRTFLAEGDEVVEALERSVERGPANARAFYELGCAYRGQRRYPKAIEALRRAVALDGTKQIYRDALQQALEESKAQQ
jgi:spermidine synthase